MSKTKTISHAGSAGETYTLTFTGGDNLNITDSTFTIASIFPTATATITGMSGNNTSAAVDFDLNSSTLFDGGAYDVWRRFSSGYIAWSNNQTKNLTATDQYFEAKNTADYFNSSNPTVRSISLSYYARWIYCRYDSSTSYGNWENGSANFNMGQTITLDVPPTCSYTQLSKDTTDYIAGFTTVSTTISSLSAKYGGTISEVKLTIGNQTATRTNNGTLSIKLNTVGTFTPVISVKDSRGQVKSYNLAAITVQEPAPTTFNYTQMSSDTGLFGAGLSIASMTVSNCQVPYGGSISDIKLTIGAQIANRTSAGELSIALNTVGVFTPVLKVTDSFGREYTNNLNAITVYAYTAPTVSFGVERVKAASQSGYSYIGEPDDEGLAAVITTNFNWSDILSDMIVPSVVVTDPNGSTMSITCTWYKNRVTSGSLIGALSDPINDWSVLAIEDMPVYGFLDDISHDPFDTNYSYKVSVTPQDTYRTGTTITQTIPPAFHTIDFLAGGHGVSMGRPAARAGHFDCDLQIATQDKSKIFREIFDIMHPVGSWHATSLRPKLTSGETGRNMVDYFDPVEAWGGTWELLDEGIVLTSAGTNYPISSGTAKNGGDTTYAVPTTTLSDAQIAHGHGFTQPTVNGGNHQHGYNQWDNSGTATGWVVATSTTTVKYKLHYVNGEGGHTHSVSGGSVSNLSGASSTRTAHGHGSVSTMQPYKNVYWWHRTS